MQYNNVNDYLTYINDNFERVSVVKPGYVYSYVYKSSKDYPIDVLKFFDIMPLTFVTSVNYTDKTFHGLNFHHMPVAERLVWYRRISVLAKILKTVQLKKSITGIPWLNYNRMQLIYEHTNRITRQYRMSRVAVPRLVPIENMNEVLRFYARTYYGVGINAVSRKFYEV